MKEITVISKNARNGKIVPNAQEYTRGESVLFILLNDSQI